MLCLVILSHEPDSATRACPVPPQPTEQPTLGDCIAVEPEEVPVEDSEAAPVADAVVSAGTEASVSLLKSNDL